MARYLFFSLCRAGSSVPHAPHIFASSATRFLHFLQETKPATCFLGMLRPLFCLSFLVPVVLNGAVGGAVAAVQTAKNLGTASQVARAMWDGHQAARQQPQEKFSHTESMGVHLKFRFPEMAMIPPKPQSGTRDFSGVGGKQ